AANPARADRHRALVSALRPDAGPRAPCRSLLRRRQGLSSARRMCETFRFPIRVYYEDTDAGGVVYYANYLKYMERARTEWLSSLGHELSTLESVEGIVFVVHRVEIDYRSPA